MSGMSKVVWAVAGLALAGAGMAVPQSAHAQYQGSITCSSTDGRFARCRTPWSDSQLDRQLSDTRCVRGQSWGSDRGSVWVDRGCRASFVEARGWGGGGGRPGYGGGGGGWQPGPDWDRQIQLTCQSNSARYQMCQVDVGRNGRVRMVRQMSDTRCEEGYSWGWNRAGVWVDRGCRATFVVDRRW